MMTNFGLDYDLLFEHMPGYVLWKDANSRYVRCNKPLANLLGLSKPTDIKGLSDHDLSWGGALAASLIQDDQEVLASGEILSTEYTLPLQGPDQNTIIIQMERQPLHDKNGARIGILAIALDISAQKRRVRTAKKKLKFIQEIIYNLPGLIYWKNKKSQYIGFNKNVVALSGLSRETLFKKTDNELDWGKKEGEEFQRDDDEIMKTGVTKVTEHEIPIRRPDGNLMVVRTEKSRLHDPDGNIVGVLGVALDVTDQKNLKDKLIKESQAKTEFIRNMEHDIRTPLGGIYSIVSILQNNEANSERKEFLSMVGLAAKELLDYCNGIIDISRLEAGTLPLVSKEFNLKELIMSVIKMESPAAISKNLSLKIDYPDEIPALLFGDPYRIQRILINLMSNSVKFTEAGFVEVLVTVASPIDDKNRMALRISVKDTGIGIPEDKQSEIFKKFSRLSPSNRGQYKGSGLGLNIIKQLVDELEGEIHLESALGKGSTFVFTLPFKRPLDSM